jgi:Family of unknown function (DUF6492)
MGNDQPFSRDFVFHITIVTKYSKSKSDEKEDKMNPMEPFILFCKSFRDDVLRVKKLLGSVVKFNKDHLPFYLSIPEKDLNIFHQYIDFKELTLAYPGKIEIITDESIVKTIPNSMLENYLETKGYISQQVIKAQAWRLLECKAYLSLDSDSFFTKDFRISNFLTNTNDPFTIMHDAKELLSLSERLGHPKVKEFFLKDSALMKSEFGRVGLDYDFGPAPLIWSPKVWAYLDEHLRDQSETIWEAFTRIPSEIRWYGETLLKYRPISLHPIRPIFNCYHYEWQADYYKAHIDELNCSEHIVGEVIQSYWDQTLTPEFAKKSVKSRIWKKIKSKLRK